MTPIELIHRLEDSYQQALATLKDVDPEQVIYEESGWRVKDIVAHVATWDAETLRSVYAYRRGSEYSIENFVGTDDFNAFAAHIRVDEPMERILADWDATAKWMHLIAHSLTPADLAAEMTHPSGKRGTLGSLLREIYEHRNEHMDDIRAALKIG